MKWNSRLFPILFVACCIAGFASCHRGHGPANKGLPVPPRSSGVGNSVANGAPGSNATGKGTQEFSATGGPSIAPSSANGFRGGQEASQRPPAPELNLPPGPAMPSTPRYLNVMAPPTIILPSDFSIGSLADLSSSGATSMSTTSTSTTSTGAASAYTVSAEGGAAGGSLDLTDQPPGLMRTLSAFLDRVVSGANFKSLVLEGRSPLVGAVLSDLAATGQPGSPVSWRLGSVRANGEEAVAAFVLFADLIDPSGPPKLPPRCNGLLHARLVESTWYIEDVSLDPAGLASDRPVPDPPWQPSLSGGDPRPAATP